MIRISSTALLPAFPATTGAKVADARFENNPAAKLVAFQKP
jgi:hypothetical protein